MLSRSGPSSTLDFSRHVRADDGVTWPQGTGEPLGLTRRLVEQRHALPPLELFVGMMTSKTLKPEHADRFRFRGLNGAGTTRTLTTANLLDIIPAYVSAVPALIRSRAIRVARRPRNYRAAVDIVVTEYGVADLRGRSFSERAERLRAIAHPRFQDDLVKSISKAA